MLVLVEGVDAAAQVLPRQGALAGRGARRRPRGAAPRRQRRLARVVPGVRVILQTEKVAVRFDVGFDVKFDVTFDAVRLGVRFGRDI